MPDGRLTVVSPACTGHPAPADGAGRDHRPWCCAAPGSGRRTGVGADADRGTLQLDGRESDARSAQSLSNNCSGSEFLAGGGGGPSPTHPHAGRDTRPPPPRRLMGAGRLRRVESCSRSQWCLTVCLMACWCGTFRPDRQTNSRSDSPPPPNSPQRQTRRATDPPHPQRCPHPGVELHDLPIRRRVQPIRRVSEC